MLSKADVEDLLTQLGDRKYMLSILVEESDAEKTLAEVKAAGYARFLGSSAGIPFQVVVIEKVKS
jgi:hypothetical protein